MHAVTRVASLTLSALALVLSATPAIAQKVAPGVPESVATKANHDNVANADAIVTGKADKKTAVSAADQKLMGQLAQANMAEVAVAELAQTKSTNEQVLKFSRQMIDDHTNAQKDLTKLANDKNVTLPKSTDAKHEALLKKMNTLDAAAFDREYIAMAALKDHEAAHKLVNTTRTKAKDPDLKALGEKMMPTIDNHLKMAKQLKAK